MKQANFWKPHDYFWNQKVVELANSGATIIAPNNLPINSIRYDDALLEHQHADHPDYIFPIELEYNGKKPKGLDPEDESYLNCVAALLFVSGNVVLTIYEYCYNIWKLDNGEYLGGNCFDKNWKIIKDSLLEIEERISKCSKEMMKK